DSLENDRSILKNKLQMNEKESSALQDKIKVLDERSFELDREIDKWKQELKRIKDQAEREKELKATYQFHGQLYELVVNPNWSVLIDLQLVHQNRSMDGLIGSYLVQKIENFYLPYEYHHKTKSAKSSYRRTIQSNRYHTIEKMTDAIQFKL